MQRFSGARLRQVRTDRGASPEQLAVAIGRSYSTIKLYEAGKVVPPGTVLQRLTAALDCRVDDLFEDLAGAVA